MQYFPWRRMMTDPHYHWWEREGLLFELYKEPWLYKYTGEAMMLFEIIVAAAVDSPLTIFSMRMRSLCHCRYRWVHMEGQFSMKKWANLEVQSLSFWTTRDWEVDYVYGSSRLSHCYWLMYVQKEHQEICKIKQGIGPVVGFVVWVKWSIGGIEIEIEIEETGRKSLYRSEMKKTMGNLSARLRLWQVPSFEMVVMRLDWIEMSFWLMRCRIWSNWLLVDVNAHVWVWCVVILLQYLIFFAQ